MKEKIASLAESLRGDITNFLREVIAIPSFSGKEGPVVERMKQAMKDFDYDEVRVDRFGNLLGRVGSGERLVAIDGHCDTVGVGNPDNWEVDPFQGDFRDGVVYGRGASDQKSGVVSAIFAGRVLKEIGVPDDISVLVVASVYEEDLEGLCWDYIVKEEGIRPEAIVLTEPTGLRVYTGQRGRVEIQVKTPGVSCHGSVPERGDNAIYKMAPIVKEVGELHRRLESDSILGKGSVTISDIRSTAPSLCAVADSCTIHLDRRLTEGETLETALAEIRALPSVAEFGAEVSVPEYEPKTHTGLVYPAKAYFPAWLMDRSHPVVQTAMEAYEDQFGGKAPIGVWQFSTNGVTTKGKHDIPSLGFGPGEEKYAHTPKDQVRVEDLVQSTAFYASFVNRMGSSN